MEQLILRQAAIDALECINGVEEVLRSLPSAQSYTIHSDGRLWVTVDDIDKVNAVVVDESKSKFCKQFYMDAEPETKKGKWLPDNNNYINEQYVCSECKNSFKVDTCMGKPMWNFCPYCGAKMER